MSSHSNDHRRIVHDKQWSSLGSGFRNLEAKAPQGYRVVSAGAFSDSPTDVTIHGSSPLWDDNEGQYTGWTFQVTHSDTANFHILLICEKSCAADRRTFEDI